MVLKSVSLLFFLIWTISSTYGPADARIKGHHNILQESSIETNFHNRSKNNCENVAGEFINLYNRKTYSTFAECQNIGLAVLRTRRNANRRRVQSKRTASRRKQTKSRPRRPGPNSKNKKQKIKSFGIAPNKKNLKPKGQTRIVGNRQRKNHVKNNRKKDLGKGVRPKGKIPSRKRVAQSQNKYRVRLGGKANKKPSQINGTIKRKFPSGSPRKTRKKSGIKDRKIKKVKIASKTTAHNKTKGKNSNSKWQIVNLQGLKLDMNSLKYKVRNGKCYEIYQGKKRNGKEKPYRRQLAKSESSCYVYKYADSAKKTCLKKVITGEKIQPVVVPIEKCANAKTDKPISRRKFGKFEINGNKCYHIYKDRKGKEFKKITNEYQCYRYEFADSSKTVCKKVPKTGQKFESVIVPVAKCGKRNAKVKAVDTEKPMSDEPEASTTVPETVSEAEPTTIAVPDVDSKDAAASESGTDTTTDPDNSEAETPSPATPKPETTTTAVPDTGSVDTSESGGNSETETSPSDTDAETTTTPVPEPKIFYVLNDETGYCEERSEKDLKDSTTVSDSETQSDQPVANNRQVKKSKLIKKNKKTQKKLGKNNPKRRPNIKLHLPKGRKKPKLGKKIKGMPSVRPKDRKTARSRNSPKTKARISPSGRSKSRPNVRTRVKPISKSRNKPNTRPRVRPSAIYKKRPIGRSRSSPSSKYRVRPISRPKAKSRDRLVAKPRSKSNRRPKKSRSRIKRMAANVRRNRNTKRRIKRPLRPVQRKRVQSRSRKHMATKKQKRSAGTYSSMEECRKKHETEEEKTSYAACYPKCKTNSGPYYCSKVDDCYFADEERKKTCRKFRTEKLMNDYIQTYNQLPKDVSFIECNENNNADCKISDKTCYPYKKNCFACDKADFEAELKSSVLGAYRCWKDCIDNNKEYCTELKYDDCNLDYPGNPPCQKKIYADAQNYVKEHPTPDRLRTLEISTDNKEEVTSSDGTCNSDSSCKKCTSKDADSILKENTYLICRPNCLQSDKKICKEVYDDYECSEYKNKSGLICEKMGKLQANDKVNEIPEELIKAADCDGDKCTEISRCDSSHKNCIECDDLNMFETKILKTEPTTPMFTFKRCITEEITWKIISEDVCRKVGTSNCKRVKYSQVNIRLENNHGYKLEKYMKKDYTTSEHVEISEDECYSESDNCEICSNEDYRSMQDGSYLVTTTLSPEEKNAPIHCTKVGWDKEFTFEYCKEATAEECPTIRIGKCYELSTKDRETRLARSMKPTHFIDRSGFDPNFSYKEMTEEECMKSYDCLPCTDKLCRDAFAMLDITTSAPDTTMTQPATTQPTSPVDTTTAPTAPDTKTTVVPPEGNVVSETTMVNPKDPVEGKGNVLSETTTANPIGSLPTTPTIPTTEKHKESDSPTSLPARQLETTITVPKTENPTTPAMPHVSDTTAVQDVIVIVPEKTAASAKPLPTTTTPETDPPTIPTTATESEPLPERHTRTTPSRPKDTVCKIKTGPKRGLCFLLSKARKRAFDTKVGDATNHAGKLADSFWTAWHTPVKKLLRIGSGALKKDINQRTVIWTFMNLNGRDSCEVIMRDLPVSDETFIGIAKRCSHKEFKNIEDDDGLDYYD